MGRTRRAQIPQVTLDLQTPHTCAVQAACMALYEAVGVRCVSRQLEVCFCGACMTEQTRQQIIATPNRDLPAALIREYSNSAHGTVGISDDLMVLLPCYAELLAQDTTVDYNESDEILWRFGAALKAGDMPGAVKAAYDAWGAAYFRHVVWVEAHELDAAQCASFAVKLLLSGGWSGAAVIALLEEAVWDEGTGAITTSWLACHFFRTRYGRPPKLDLDFIWRYGLQDGALEAVRGWFTSRGFGDALDAAMGTDLPYARFMDCKIASDLIEAGQV